MNAKALPGLCGVIISLFLIGCEGQESIDNLRVTKYEINRESKGCATQPDQCFTISVNLPLVQNGSDSFQVLFNQTVQDFVFDRLNEFTPVDGSGQKIEVLIDTIFEDYETYLTEVDNMDNGVFAVWEIEIKGIILFESEAVVCLMVDSYSYTGGAHPDSETYYINFDKQSGEILNIKDVIIQVEPVRIMALEMLKSSLGIPNQEDIIEHGFLISDEEFVLPDNFAITHHGIEFLANPYEIAPYAMGTQKIIIPFEAIEEYLILEKY